MRDDILRLLRMIPAATTDMIADDLGLIPREVQTVLHQMDDDGDVILRGGWYRISEKARRLIS